MKPFMFLVIACIVLSQGCTSNVSKTSEKGLFHFNISGKGHILKEGRNEVDINVADDKGVAVEGARIEIAPFMPEHGHGSMWPPAVTEKGKGLYRAVIPLMMSGHWELRIRISKGNIQDGIVFDFPDVVK